MNDFQSINKNGTAVSDGLIKFGDIKENDSQHVNNDESLQFEGIWHFELFDEQSGEKVVDHIQKNIVVDNAIIYMAQGHGPADFTALHLGDASFPTTPSVSDLQLNQDFFTGTTVHTPLVKNGTFAFQKKCTLALTDAVGTITEAGLFTPSGTMFNRILLNPPITKTAQQTGFVTVQITIRRV